MSRKTDREAAAVFEDWHGFPPDHVEVLDVPRLDGQQMVFLGNLLRIDYKSPKWSRKRPGQRPLKAYFHESTGQPYILCNPQRNVLVIFDPTGQLAVTADGLIK